MQAAHMGYVPTSPLCPFHSHISVCLGVCRTYYPALHSKETSSFTTQGHGMGPQKLALTLGRVWEVQLYRKACLYRNQPVPWEAESPQGPGAWRSP